MKRLLSIVMMIGLLCHGQMVRNGSFEQGGKDEADGWKLNTILEEPGNCHLYEKLGYRRTGDQRRVRPNMTIIDYVKD